MPRTSQNRQAADRVRFPGISAKAFEHAADQVALSAMAKVPGFDAALRKVIGVLGERSLRNIYLASSVRVSEQQFPKLNAIYEDCLKVLDVSPRPDLFVAQTPFINAGAIGADRPFVVLNSATLALLDETELRFILGHELGHVLADHVLFKTMLVLLLRVSTRSFGLPFRDLALLAIIGALLEWDRKSELSSDRAGLLCCQDSEASYRVFMKLAGGDQLGQMQVEEFVRQAEEYQSQGTVADSVHKILNLLGKRHPFHVLRLQELKGWIDSGEYQKTMAGDYPRREADGPKSIRDEFVKAAESYKKAYDESEDPLIQMLRGLGNMAKEASTEMLSQLQRKMKRGDGSGHA